MSYPRARCTAHCAADLSSTQAEGADAALHAATALRHCLQELLMLTWTSGLLPRLLRSSLAA